MKKNFLLSMIIMLMTAIGSFAQDQKEYNMVITLNNGTTVTLGHNDIKEITFNDGAVSISGNMVNTIDSLSYVTRNLEDLTRKQYDRLDYVEKNCFTEIDDNRKLIYENKDKIVKNEEMIAVTRTEADALNANLMNALQSSMQEIVQLQEVVTVQDNQIQQLNQKIEALEFHLNELYNKIDNNSLAELKTA